MRYLLLFLYLCVSNAVAVDPKIYIPEQAYALLPAIKAEVNNYFPGIQHPEYFAGLAEQESCIHLKHKLCFNPRSQLKTYRELGIGLFQITKAYKADGSVRFDSLEEMVKKHNAELKELAWSNVRDRPDLQIRTMLLMIKDNLKALYKVVVEVQRFKMADAAYNGGLGGLNKERMACGLAKGCDPQIWDNNVERYCLKSKKAIYGNRSACDINREHVDNIFDIRMPKYIPYFK